MTMKISCIAPWFGSKRELAPEICRQLGPHRAYFGLCFGSLAVELEKEESGHETVVDLHGDVCNLAMVLASERCPDLYGQLARTLVAEPLFERARLICATEAADVPEGPIAVTDAHVERSFYYFICCWQGRNGSAGTFRPGGSFAVRYTPGGGHGGQRFANAVDSIPDWHQRMRRMTIMRRDLFKVVPKIDDTTGIAIYCDPPYILEGSQYLHSFTDEDHRRLAKELRRFRKARVVVSYYANPVLADLYPGWTILDCSRTKNLTSQAMRGKKGTAEAPEVLLINQKAFGSETPSMF